MESRCSSASGNFSSSHPRKPPPVAAKPTAPKPEKKTIVSISNRSARGPQHTGASEERGVSGRASEAAAAGGQRATAPPTAAQHRQSAGLTVEAASHVRRPVGGAPDEERLKSRRAGRGRHGGGGGDEKPLGYAG
ncbi:hypothetical protein OsJ_15347 [Oryza sativa Japonica Group]|uniref:Uncharacterized protein n=1 Tax=Oryza sativa subsp. japonica TaxID=39947 RepID=B9FFY7_ORYSJ|nr:hypothetical protein OsJ_15347 [Oryza sativa Japonica Group]